MNNEYLNRMKELLKDRYDSYLKALDEKPYRSIRLNKIDIDTFNKNINMSLEKIEYDMDGYYLLDDNKYGNHPYHHLGAFYFQEPSAMAPVNLFNFNGDEKVLDLCASPGGKSSQILRRIPNGLLVSNEIDAKRSQVLFSNLERLGYSNAIITNNSPHDLANVFEGYFDVILIDAPCSGEGMMRKEEEARNGWTLDNVILCHNRDIEIINEANKMLKKGGHLIYSTCTFSKEEDEDIVEYIKTLGYKLCEGLDNTVKHLSKGLIDNTYRMYPMDKGEGQFMALLEKESDGLDFRPKKNKIKNDKEIDIVKKFIKDNTTLDLNLNIIKNGNRYYLSNVDFSLKDLNVKNFGVELGEVINNRFEPYHHFFKALGHYFKNKVYLSVLDSRVDHYLKGEEIICDSLPGYGVIVVDGLILGGFKASNNHLKNHYPKGLRNTTLYFER